MAISIIEIDGNSHPLGASADNVAFDGTGTGIEAGTVQEAIEEVSILAAEGAQSGVVDNLETVDGQKALSAGMGNKLDGKASVVFNHMHWPVGSSSPSVGVGYHERYYCPENHTIYHFYGRIYASEPTTTTLSYQPSKEVVYYDLETATAWRWDGTNMVLAVHPPYFMIAGSSSGAIADYNPIAPQGEIVYPRLVWFSALSKLVYLYMDGQTHRHVAFDPDPNRVYVRLGSSPKVVQYNGSAWVDVIDISSKANASEVYSKSEVNAAITSLQTALNTITQDGATQGVIDTFNEVKDFLAGLNNTDTLVAKLATLVPMRRTINGKTLDSDVEIGINDIQGLANAIANAGGSNVSIDTDSQGALIINVGTDSYVIDLNHTHEAMAKLRLYTQATMPQVKALDTIYAQVDNAEIPTEVQKLFIAGCEFEKGWVPDNGEAVIKSPSNGTMIELGEIDQGSASKTIIVRGWNLTGALTVAISGTGLSMNYGQLTGQTSITIPQADALLGVAVEIVYSGNDGIDDGALVISQGNEVLSAVVVKAEDFALPAGYTRLQYVENAVRGIDTGILAVNSQSLTSAIPGTEWDIDVKCDNIPSSNQMIICTNEDMGHWVEAMTDGTFGIGNTDYRIGDITTRTTLHVSWKSNGVTISCNGESRTRAYSYQNVHNVCLFRNINPNQQQHEGYQFTGKVYSIRCTNGGSFDGVPARRNSDNKVGLYDIENDVFYPLS